jgi:hypothetical protein
MQNSHHRPGVSQVSLERKHESENPPLSGIVLVGGLVLLTMLVCLGIIWVTMDSLSKRRPMERSQALGIISAPNLQPLERFPMPNLQVVPHDELVALTARGEQELRSYGWLDRTNRVVRIPIDRAMDLVSEHGLPRFTTNAPARRGPSSVELIRERSQSR